jgi:5'-nucleotidase
MSEIEKTVLIDMDGVMADFDTAATAHLPRNEILNRSNFYVAHDYPMETRPSIEAVYNAPGFFENLQPMPGMIEGWQALIDNGYHPRIASAPLSSNISAIEGKVKWLDRVMVPEFGASVVTEAIIDKDKWKYGGLVLLDDRPDVSMGPEGRNVAEWQHVLFGWTHLNKVPLAQTAFRLLSWRDVPTLLGALETIAESRSND